MNTAAPPSLPTFNFAPNAASSIHNPFSSVTPSQPASQPQWNTQAPPVPQLDNVPTAAPFQPQWNTQAPPVPQVDNVSTAASFRPQWNTQAPPVPHLDNGLTTSTTIAQAQPQWSPQPPPVSFVNNSVAENQEMTDAEDSPQVPQPTLRDNSSVAMAVPEDSKATSMPPSIPDSLTEAQKRQFVTGYRFKSLIYSMFTQIKNPCEPVSVEVFTFYEEKKREIIAAQGLPADISLKRKAYDDGRTDTTFKRVSTYGLVDPSTGHPACNFLDNGREPQAERYMTRPSLGFDGACDDRDEDASAGAKKARRSDVSYPSLPPSKDSQTASLFENITSDVKNTSESTAEGAARSPAKRPIAKLRTPNGSYDSLNTMSTGSKGSESPTKHFNPWSMLKIPGRDSAAPAAEPNGALSHSIANSSAVASQLSAGGLGSKPFPDTSGNQAQSSSFQGNVSSSDSKAKSPESASASGAAKPTEFSVPKFGATSGTNFLAQFGQVAKKTEEESAKIEKAKRKAEEFDSDEDDEAEWERQYEEEQHAKRQKIEEAKKTDGYKFVPHKGTEPAKQVPGKAPTSVQVKPTQSTASPAPDKASTSFQFKPTQSLSSQSSEKAPTSVQFKPTQTEAHQAPEKASTFFQSKPSQSTSSLAPEKASTFFQFKPTQTTSSPAPEKPSTSFQFKPTQSTPSQASEKASTLFQFKPTQTTSSGSGLLVAPRPGESVLSAVNPSSPQTQTGNIFGHLSNQPSDAEDNKANNDAESEESDEDEPLAPSTPQPSLGAPDKVTDTSNSSSRSTSRSLFDRIETNTDGTLKREIQPSNETEMAKHTALEHLLPEKAKQSLAGPNSSNGKINLGPSSSSETTKPSLFSPINTSQTSNIFGQPSSSSTASNLFRSLSSNKATSSPTPSTTPQLDRTWKNDSPIKFNSINNPPSLSITAASPTKPTPTEQKTGSFGGLFGSPKPDATISPTKPAFNLFGASSTNTPGATVGFNFGGPSKSLAGLSAPSVFSSNATSRATSPGFSTGGESANEGAEDNVGPDEQIDLANARVGEENEELLFEAKARAQEHALNEKTEELEWTARGLGMLRVLRHRETNKARIILRMDPSGKVILNTALLDQGNYKLARDKSVMFMGAKNDGHIAKWMVTVGRKDDATKLVDILTKNKSN